MRIVKISAENRTGGIFDVERGNRWILYGVGGQRAGRVRRMMVGFFYAIVMVPATLEAPQAALSFGSFHIGAALAGVALVFGMQMIKERGAGNRD